MNGDCQINVGDTVTVCFGLSDDDSMLKNAIVRHVPSNTGEAWIVETDRQIYYVQTYGCIIKEKP